MSCLITLIILDSSLLIIRAIKILFKISLARQSSLTDGYVSRCNSITTVVIFIVMTQPLYFLF